MRRINSQEELNIIGNNLRKARLKTGISQKLLSERLETVPIYICRGSISRIEAGKRAVTDIEIRALATILNVSPNELFDWEKLKHQED